MTPRRRARTGQGGVYPYKLTDGTTLYRVAYMAPDRESGEMRAVTKRGFKSEKEATAYRRRVLNELEAGMYVRPRRTTVSEYAEEWIAGPRGKESTRHYYESKTRRYIIPRLGNVPLQRLTPRQIDILYRELERAGGQANKPLSPATVRKVHTILRQMLGRAVIDGLLARNPTDTTSPPTATEAHAPEQRVWTAEQLGLFLRHEEGHRLFALWVLYATTGMRRGEALGLRWADLDLDQGRASIRQTVTRVGRQLVIGTPKGNRARVVDLDEHTVAVLRAQKRWQAGDRLRLGSDWSDLDLVFAHDGLKRRGAAGQPMRPDTVLRLFQDRIRAVNRLLPADEQLPVIHIHSIRHSWATLAMNQGVHVRVVQERLGHATAQITLNTYSHVGDTLQRAAAERIAASILSPEPLLSRALSQG